MRRVDAMKAVYPELPRKVEAVDPSGYVTDLALLENRYQFQRYVRDLQRPSST